MKRQPHFFFRKPGPAPGTVIPIQYMAHKHARCKLAANCVFRWD
jgi:hypothetical protein